MSLEDLLTHRRSAGVLVRLSTQSAQALSSLATLFDAEAGSRGAMLSASAKGGNKSGQPVPSPMRVFPKLGVAYGAVTRDGLDAMRKHEAVVSVTEANGLRMIRPVPYAPLGHPGAARRCPVGGRTYRRWRSRGPSGHRDRWRASHARGRDRAGRCLQPGG
jgi:hypothetical protein